jgi:hypothetical protein
MIENRIAERAWLGNSKPVGTVVWHAGTDRGERKMTSELQRDIYKILRDSQDKYTYFLLAAAGAGIALAVNQTQNAKLTWSHAPLGLAVVVWGLSFFLGCRHVAYVNSTLYANAELLRVQAGEHPRAGNHPDAIEAASAGIRAAIENNSDRANSVRHWQCRDFVAGGVLYVAWHVLEMYLRS